MAQMTHSKPIKKEGQLTQAWLDGFEQYRERTALFPHAKNDKVSQITPRGPTLPGFEEKAHFPVATHRATFPMFLNKQNQR